MTWLLNRLKERSTWLAIFTLAGLVGIKLEPEFREAIINAILAVSAVVAFVFRENIRERSTDIDQSSGTETPLPPIELTGKSESPEIPPMAFDDATPRRSASDAWLRDPVPSESEFKHSIDPNKGSVGWNDDN